MAINVFFIDGDICQTLAIVDNETLELVSAEQFINLTGMGM